MTVKKGLWASPAGIPTLFAGIKLLIHLWTNLFAGYGIFRDELYYIVSTDHLAAGFVDQPPLSIFILALNRLILGDSLFALRFLPALAGAAAVYLVGVLTTELGGGRKAQALACAAAVVSMIYLGMDAIYSMNAFSILLWQVAILIVLKIVQAPNIRLWLLLGAVLGIGLLNKIDVLWLGAGIAAGIVFTPLRSQLRTPGPWLSAMLAFLFFLPYLLWNAMNDWAHIEFISNATSGKYSGLSAVEFITGQFLLNNPSTVPLWLGGLYFLFSKRGHAFRIGGVIFATAFVILLANGHSKAEYLCSAFGILFAAGGVLFEFSSAPWMRFAALRLYPIVLGAGLLLAPLTLPILSEQSYIEYASVLGVRPHTAESKRLGDLPQFYADMHGWEELASAVGAVYRTLTPEEQRSASIYAQNYGEASAMTFFGRSLGLPHAISGHNSYYLWGPRSLDSSVVIVVGGNRQNHEEIFEEVTLMTRFSAPYVMPYEDNLPIFVCRRLKVPIAEVWPRTKNYS